MVITKVLHSSKQIEVKNSVNNLKRSQWKFILQQLVFIVINLSQQNVFGLLYFITKYGYKKMVNWSVLTTIKMLIVGVHADYFSFEKY